MTTKAKRRHKRKVPVRSFRKVTGEWVKESVDWLLEKGCGCCHFKVWEDDDGREYDVCIGWHQGYDPDDKYLIHAPDEPEWCVAWKIGFQDRNNACQCDFDVDWLMPWDPDTGDVCDTCSAVIRMKTKAGWDRYAKFMNKAAVMAARYDQETKEKHDEG